MKVQAELSLYPLRTACVGETIREFADSLRRAGFDVHVGSMSSIIAGDHTELFAALAQSFAAVASRRQVVLSVKVSNACPPISEHQNGENNV